MSTTGIMEGCVRGFHHIGAAYYAKAVLPFGEYIDKIQIGLYHSEGGTTGEFSITWEKLGGKITPCLHAFDDSWAALWQFRDVLDAMAAVNDEDIAPAAFCELLKGCGIEDMTNRNG